MGSRHRRFHCDTVPGIRGNTAIAACMELSNELDPATISPAVLRRAIETLIRLLGPMTPHLAEELWAAYGHTDGLTAGGWPEFDPAQIDEDDAEYPVQIQGKVRARIRISRTLTGAALEQAVLNHPEVVAALGGKPVKKAIIVAGKIANLVV